MGESKWTRNRPEDCRAASVSEGCRTLNVIIGEGWRVTVLKEETVIPLGIGFWFVFVVLDGEMKGGEEAVTMATG